MQPLVRTKVFIVDDDELLRGHLGELLDGSETVEVVGGAGSAEEALERLDASGCEVVLIDLGLPGMSGVELIRRVVAGRAPPLIMAHTVFDDRRTVFEALKAGATSYVLKGCAPEDLVAAVADLVAGGAPMSPSIARAVIREIHSSAGADVLTPRERQVLKMIDSGLTYKEIAQRLVISVHTVHAHIKHIYERLQAGGKLEALHKARARGLL